jgi:hypothetical protein
MSGPNLAHGLTTPAQPSEEKRSEWPMPGARRGAVAAPMADVVPRLLAARRWLPRDEVFATTTRELGGGGGWRRATLRWQELTRTVAHRVGGRDDPAQRASRQGRQSGGQ